MGTALINVNTRTNKAKLLGAFRDFANAPRKYVERSHICSIQSNSENKKQCYIDDAIIVFTLIIN